jgi:hypothetical protein
MLIPEGSVDTKVFKVCTMEKLNDISHKNCEIFVPIIKNENQSKKGPKFLTIVGKQFNTKWKTNPNYPCEKKPRLR